MSVQEDRPKSALEVAAEALDAAGQTLTAASQALAATKALLAEIQSTPATNDADGLVGASDRPFGLSPSTFRRWVSAGKLRAFRAERGRLVAWRSDVRKCIESRPYQVPVPGDGEDGDLIDRALASGRLRKLVD